MKLLDENSLETVDILSLVFQYLALQELFALQKVSPFFYRTIEHLKSLLIRPIYEIGLVSSNRNQLSEFLQMALKSQLITTSTKENPQKQTTRNLWVETDIDMTDKNDGEELKSVKFGDYHTIHAFKKIEKEFVFKNDRFRVFFYPLYCEQSTSLSHDDYQRLDGFIFLNPEKEDGYATMPSGCSFCAALLDYSHPANVANESVKMPVRSFGSFKSEKANERFAIEQSILDCINYISENSNRSIQLNSIGDGLKSSLLEKISLVIKETSDEMVETRMNELFKNKYTLKELILTEKVRYMARKLNFFNYPHNVQWGLLKRLYTAHLGSENVKFTDDLYITKVIFNQQFNSRKRGTYVEHIVDMKTTLSFHLTTQEIKFEYKKISERTIGSGEQNKKCIIC